MIDEQRLKELEDDFGAEDLAEILDAFLEEAAEGVDALAAMFSDGADPERRAQLHFLKGCARNVGASTLADLCEQYEQAEHGETAFGSADFQKISAGFEDVRAYFSGDQLRRTA